MTSFIAKTSACEKKAEVNFVFEQNTIIRHNAIRLFVTNLVGVEDRREYGMHRKVGRNHRDYGERAFARARSQPRDFYLIDIQPHLSCLALATFHLSYLPTVNSTGILDGRDGGGHTYYLAIVTWLVLFRHLQHDH